MLRFTKHSFNSLIHCCTDKSQWLNSSKQEPQTVIPIMAFASFTAAHLDEHVVGEKWPVKMWSTTNSNIFVNTKPPSPAYGNAGSSSKVDDTHPIYVFLLATARDPTMSYKPLWTSIMVLLHHSRAVFICSAFSNVLCCLGSSCSTLVDMWVLLVFFHTLVFKEQCCLHALGVEVLLCCAAWVAQH
jgi:hypothetical protein